MDISELLLFSNSQGASDLHISSGEPPMIRINGDMQKLDMPALSREEVHALLYDIFNDQQRKVFEENHEIDFSIAFKEIARFRVNAFVQARGESAVFRTIPTNIMTIEELGLPKILENIARCEKGLVLVTGPTGSGKSTTLAAMIDMINNEFKGHIITIEDPIEFVHKSKNCLISQRELGPHTHSFANALRAALREDPDIILVGEMRDLETIQLALTAAETGHLVFGTLHTSSAPKTVDRVIDVFPSEQQEQIRAMFSESIQAVITQTLVKKRNGEGRVAALEIMIGTPAVRNLIREAKISQIPSIIQTSQNVGMKTMDQAIKELFQKNIISKNDALQLVSNPSFLSQ
ncbi:MAG: twitching motility protein PilT [Candidatus Schekmanbacteria bacterium RBG_16_38_10]|uniref:Twitching motility protein PilT n=1 Tax=Candidatus Schekmanbacteria bacterium RBG_16_38_10 TaxID=1817879 RepID=A0A1F7RT83_9BACT|nr:MAG: twitching motility protein PilT [Candidatus Schekmanbacteria bacterium RBG_16_38_10]